MKFDAKSQNTVQTESGGALIMSILITFLLGIACIGMLSAVTASSREGTDALSSTKAYYAAESGIQASVNALRYGSATGGPVSYMTAVNGFTNSGTLNNLPGSSSLIYANCNGDQRVLIDGDCNNGYKITVRDPDNSQSALAFRTSGAQFRAEGTSDPWLSTRVIGSGASTTTFEWVPNPTNPTPLTFDVDHPSQTAALGSIQVTNGSAGGAAITTETAFKVFYSLVLPGNPGWLISGKIGTTGAVTILSARYTVAGSDIELCGNSVSCGSLALSNTASAIATLPVNGLIKPKEPSRLLVTATGFGPGRSKKVLEAVMQKSPLDGANSSSPFSMNGPCSEPGNPANVAVFQAGRSAVTTYSGASSGGVVAPAFGFNSPCNLVTANTWIATYLTPNNRPPQVLPPPAFFENEQLPDWQRSPLQMEEKVQLYRAQAQYSGTYYNPASHKITDPGYIAGQTGQITTVTFCEGDCTVDGDRGGGILVVTGKLTSLGGFGFKGLILVTGPNGWERAGGGCGSIIGNVVISPYTSANLSTNVFTLPPKYQITGAGCSGVTYASLDDLFEGENSTITNFIRGVAEK